MRYLLFVSLVLLSGCSNTVNKVLWGGEGKVVPVSSQEVTEVIPSYCVDHQSFCDLVKPNWKNQLAWKN